MANAGKELLIASDNLKATTEQRHCLSVAYNVHCASGLVASMCLCAKVSGCLKCVMFNVRLMFDV